MLLPILLRLYKLMKSLYSKIYFLILSIRSWYIILFFLPLFFISLPFILDHYFNKNAIIIGIVGWVNINEHFFELLHIYKKIIITSIPVLLAFTYFVYREQQSISLRHQNFSTLLFYICFSISSVILSYYFEMKIDITLANMDMTYPFKIIILLLTISLTILFLIRLILKLLLGIDLRFQLKNSNKRIWKLVNLAYFSGTEKISDLYYKSIHNHIESIFQILEYALANKMNKLFKDEFAKLSVLLERIMEQSPHKRLNIYPKRLTELHPTHFFEFYSVVLNNIGNLTFNLYQDNRLSDLESAFNILKALEPNKVTELYPVYLNSIEDISLKLLSNKDFPFEKMLSFLESFSKSESIRKERNTNLIGVIFIYQSVLKKAVESNDVKNVTAITYSLDAFSNALKPDDISNQSNSDVITQLYKSIFASLQKAFEIKHETITHIDEVALYILLQGSLKSIELGCYGVTGQLIKRITTDFNGQTINDVFDKFYVSKGNIKIAYKDFNQDFELNDLLTDYNFNHRSFEYCIQKLLFLLLGQEALIIDKNISFTEFHKSEVEFINFSYFSQEYLDYVVRKIASVENRYGLIFLKIEGFVDNLALYIKDKIS